MSVNETQNPGNFQQMGESNPSLRGLTRLKEIDSAEYEFGPNVPDVRGWKVVDGESKKIGVVNDLIVDATEMRIRYLDVLLDDSATSSHHLLIPVGAVIADGEDDEIIANHLTKERIESYPRYTGDNLTREHESVVKNTWHNFNQNAIRSQTPGSHPDTGAEITPNFYEHSYFDQDRFYGPRYARQDSLGATTFPEGEGRFAFRRRRIG